MDRDDDQHHEIDDEAADAEDEDVYLLELDDAEDVDDVTREALAAVERHGRSERPSELDDANEEAAVLRAELEDLRDRSMRTLADFENFRKRTERERRDNELYASAEVLQELLPIIDNLDRALTANGGVEELKSGIQLILRQMHELLRRRGAEPIDAEGEPFDPAVHEAVMRDESTEVERPTVIEELQRGYRLHDRLLRPAMVRVAMPAEDDSSS